MFYYLGFLSFVSGTINTYQTMVDYRLIFHDYSSLDFELNFCVLLLQIVAAVITEINHITGHL